MDIQCVSSTKAKSKLGPLSGNIAEGGWIFAFLLTYSRAAGLKTLHLSVITDQRCVNRVQWRITQSTTLAHCILILVVCFYNVLHFFRRWILYSEVCMYKKQILFSSQLFEYNVKKFLTKYTFLNLKLQKLQFFNVSYFKILSKSNFCSVSSNHKILNFVKTLFISY